MSDGGDSGDSKDENNSDLNDDLHDQIEYKDTAHLISVLLPSVPDLFPPLLLLKFLANLKVTQF